MHRFLCEQEGRKGLNYVIFCQNISRIGGAQHYVLWKAKYLRGKGFNVLLITTEAEPLLLHDFLEFDYLVIPETIYPFYLFSKQVQKITSERIKAFIETNSSPRCGIIFESINMASGTWSERVAKIFNSTSLIYEVNGAPILNETLAKFAGQKILKKELKGCSRFLLDSLMKNFPQFYDPGLNDHINIPFEEKAVEHSNNNFSFPKVDDNAIGILTISRVAKGFLGELIKEVCILFEEKKNRKFFLTLVLNKKSGKEVQALKKLAFHAPRNLEVIFLGPLVPMPSALFKKHNIFVGQGTAALHAISNGLPSVIVSSKTGMAAGIFGIDVFDFGYFQNYDSKVSALLSNLINQPEFLEKAKIEGLKVFQDEFSEEAISGKFRKWIIECVEKHERDYLDFDSVSLNLKEKIKKLLVTIFGAKTSHVIFQKIMELRRVGGVKS